AVPRADGTWIAGGCASAERDRMGLSYRGGTHRIECGAWLPNQRGRAESQRCANLPLHRRDLPARVHHGSRDLSLQPLAESLGLRMRAAPSSSTETPAKKATVSLRGVRVVFKNPDTGKCQCVLGGIDLDLFPGEILCVVGPSGCGKSTLLNGIGGFRRFTEGVALIDGAPIGPPNRERGVVFQDYPVLNFCTALGNVAAGLDFERFSLLSNLLPFTRRRRSTENRQRALEYLRAVGMEQHAHKYPTELSGGQRQRVAIAQAIAMRPKVL